MLSHYLRPGVATVLLLLGTMTQAEDVEVVLDKNLGNKVLQEIPFPLERVFHPSNFTSGDVSIDAYDPSTNADALETPEVGTLVEDLILDELLNPNDEFYNANSNEPDVQLIRALQGRLGGDTVRDREQLRAELRALVRSGSPEGKLLLAALKAIKVDVVWVKLRILDRPNAVVSKPLEIRDMKVAVQARIEVCVKLFGKWRCVGLTSPTVRLEARKLSIAFVTRPPVLYGKPSFSDLDIVIKIRIFGMTFTIRIGVTGFVNRAIAKELIEIADFSNFEVPIPETNKVMRVETIDTEARPNGLAVKANLKAGT